MQFFTDCNDLTEATKLWKKLMKENHPDRGGDTKVTQTINAEFDEFCKFNFANFKENVHNKFTGKPYDFDDVYFAEIVVKIITLDIEIEQVGYWLYVRGYDNETYKKLTKLGFWNSRKHGCLIFNGEGANKRKRTRMTMYQIRSRH